VEIAWDDAAGAAGDAREELLETMTTAGLDEVSESAVLV
jgi:hypothetical protein